MTSIMRADLEVIAEIARIGELRSPVEACGLILPLPMPSKDDSKPPQWIIELPNRSLEPASFGIQPTDIRLALATWVDHYRNHPEANTIGVWHTHPGGKVGPSYQDMACRLEDIPQLVVALHPDGTHTASWY